MLVDRDGILGRPTHVLSGYTGKTRVKYPRLLGPGKDADPDIRVPWRAKCEYAKLQ
jgi:hypothetical protein